MFEHDHNHGPEHPKDRPMEDGDPLELHGVELDGDVDLLLTCLVEEFAHLGWDADMILSQFSQPQYQGPYRLLRRLGPEMARQRVEQIVARCGVWKTSTIEQISEPEIVNLTIGGRRPVEL